MALTIDSNLGDILADEKGKAILEKHLPGVSTNPQVAIAKGITLRVIAPMSQGILNDKKLNAINEDLVKI